MNVETIIAIVTAGIAFLTSVVSFTYNLIKTRKERVQKVVLENRIHYMNEIRDGFTSIIGVSDPKAISLARGDSNVMKGYTERVFHGYGKIKTFLKPFYKIEKEILASLDRLYDGILAALSGDEEEAANIVEYRDDFADRYLKYDWAYWKYIQSQKDGEYVDSDGAFDTVYNKLVEDIKHDVF